MEINITKIFNDFWFELSQLIPNIISSILIILLFFLLGKLFYKTIGKRIQQNWKDKIVTNFIAEATKWGFYVMGIIIALNIVGFGGIASHIIAGAGISAIIFGFAFKDLGENFLAGILLALNRPFEIGDIIEVDSSKGTVEDVDLRTTHIRNSEGKDIYIPNSSIIKNTLTNFTKDGLFRINFMLGIAPECDIEFTRSLILNYLTEQNTILKDPIPNVIVLELGEFTTDIQVQFWINLFDNKKNARFYLGNNIRSRTITEIKRILDSKNIEMPSQVIEHKMYRENAFVVR